MTATRTEVGECRQCRSFCDKMIEPRACIEIGCRFVYSYVDRLDGRQYVGCMQEVFGAQVDLAALQEKGGFGGVKMTGSPLPHCPFEVEQAYNGEGESYGCVNPRFFDCNREPPATAEGKAFTLDLTQDQEDIRDWVHGFAEGVVRPAAHEWDEREETPWPVIQEAAKIGLYAFEGLAQFWADETGLTLPIANEELFWGEAGIGMAIMGT